MRIRSTKPEFWRSKTIAQLDWDVRFVLKGLEAYVDDNGVGKNDIALIASDAFPRDLYRDSFGTLQKLSEAISVLAEAGLIIQYEVDGEELLYIDKWKDVQRVDKPRPGRFRRPDGTIEYAEVVNRETYRNFQKTSEKVPPVTGEQGNRGTGEKEPPYPPDLEPSPPQPPTRKTGDEIARTRFGAIPAAPSASARDVAAAYSASLVVPLEPKLLGQVSGQIDQCLRGNIPPDAIAAGLGAWTRSDSWAPSQIPNFVHKAANGRAINGLAKPTEKALDYGTVAEQVIAALEPKP